ncbi:MAG TPA: Fe-Mn family superoxide dismutase [Parcubacteria group bacterium]|jgi:Fe-Mn family superoxide dismutase|nr:Fe-Mn family superoxide dismutase [Parcubacteria group bacterium]
MAQFEEKKFNLGELKGISAKNIEEHLKLYSGYVKNANLVNQKLFELWTEDAEKNTYVMNELIRRFSFEYNGMRNHEIYFESLSGGATPLSDGQLKKAIEENYGTVETFLKYFKTIAMIRGIGWAMLWFDKKENKLLTSWVDEQHLGQLQGCAPILALDMWEHSYVADYQPSGKKQYVEDFFANLNWSVIEKNFLEVK